MTLLGHNIGYGLLRRGGGFSPASLDSLEQWHEIDTGLRVTAGSSVNLMPYSERFDLWPTKSNITVVAEAATAPSVSLPLACKLTPSASNGYVARLSISVTASQDRTFSLWVKQASGHNGTSQARIDLYSADSGDNLYDFVPSAEWTRVETTLTGDASTSMNVYIYPDIDTGTEEILVWGAQLEEASSANTYEPTGKTPANAECIFWQDQGDSERHYQLQSGAVSLVPTSGIFNSHTAISSEDGVNNPQMRVISDLHSSFNTTSMSFVQVVMVPTGATKTIQTGAWKYPGATGWETIHNLLPSTGYISVKIARSGGFDIKLSDESVWSLDTVHVFILTLVESGAVEFYVDGVSVSSGVTSPAWESTAGEQMKLFGLGNTNNELVHIAAEIRTSDILTAGEIADITSYLRGKYA